jgi:hypothetical protein
MHSLHKEFNEWIEETSQSKISSLFERASHPIEKNLTKASKLLPENFREQIEKSVEKSFLGLLNLSEYSTSSEKTWNALAKLNNTNIASIDDLYEQDFSHIKKFIFSQIALHQKWSMTHGFALGLGGAFLTATDVPLAISSGLRLILVIGQSFGIDFNIVEERLLCFHILSMSLVEKGTEEFIKGLDTPFDKIGMDSSVAMKILKSKGNQITLLNNPILKKIFDNLIKKSTQSIFKRKIAQLVPVIGGIAGAHSNFQFIKNVGVTAYYLYLKKVILESKISNGLSDVDIEDV